MRGFLDIAGSAARVGFLHLADPAVLVAADGQQLQTRAAIERESQTQGHTSQPRLVGRLPADVGSVIRGAVLTVEGKKFSVERELDRDQHELKVLLREHG